MCFVICSVYFSSVVRGSNINYKSTPLVVNELEGLSKASQSQASNVTAQLIELRTRGRRGFSGFRRRRDYYEGEEVSDEEDCSNSSAAAGARAVDARRVSHAQRNEARLAWLRQRAAASLSWLEEQFETAHHPRLRAVTTRGNPVNSMHFRSEELNAVCRAITEYFTRTRALYCTRTDMFFIPRQNESRRLMRSVILGGVRQERRPHPGDLCALLRRSRQELHADRARRADHSFAQHCAAY